MGSFRRRVKQLARPLGADALLKEIYVHAGLAAEQLHHFFAGRPAASKAIVLAGSGRSGTTWLTSLLTTMLGAQQIYEPLHPSMVPEVLSLTGWQPDCEDVPHIRVPYLSTESSSPQWRDFRERVLTG